MPHPTFIPEGDEFVASDTEAILGILDALNDAATWMQSLAESGPDLMSTSYRKVVEEASELSEDTILEEWADVAICLLGVALQEGWEPQVLAEAIRAKVAKNRGRTWFAQPDGLWRHTRHDPRASRTTDTDE